MGKYIQIMGDFQCGQGITSSCEGTTYVITPYTDSAGKSYTIDQRFNNLVGEVISILTFGIKVGVSMSGNTFTENQLRGLNAIRCAITNGANSTWMLLAAVWYAATEFGYEGEIQSYINQGLLLSLCGEPWWLFLSPLGFLSFSVLWIMGL